MDTMFSLRIWTDFRTPQFFTVYLDLLHYYLKVRLPERAPTLLLYRLVVSDFRRTGKPPNKILSGLTVIEVAPTTEGLSFSFCLTYF